MQHEIIYYYSAHSAFAWLGSARLSEICANHSVRLVHRPILLSPVIEAQNSLPFRDRTQAHVDYFFGREIERWAEFRGVQVVNHRPTFHDADYTLASGMIIALGEVGPEVDQLAHAILAAHWVHDADLSDRATLAGLARDLGHQTDVLMSKAQSPEVMARLKFFNDEARALPIFGSPTYVVNGDPFYGQDRLELVEHTLDRPFAPGDWKNPPVG